MTEKQELVTDDKDGDYARFMVSSKQEMAQILRAIMKQNGMVTGYFNQGQGFVLTSFLLVDPVSDNIVVDHGPDAQANQQILASKKIIMVTSQNNIKIQFSVSKIDPCTIGGRAAFRIPFPDTLLKLQRREFYRLTVPLRENLRCSVPDLGGKAYELEVADLSVGGAGLMGIPLSVTLEIGMRLENCRMTLAEEGVIAGTLEIRNIREGTKRSGEKYQRIGCVFIDIPPPHQAMIQRFIIRVERERRALA